jgi:hypothetical protein
MRRRSSDDFAMEHLLHVLEAGRHGIRMPSGIVRAESGGSADGLSGRARHDVDGR